jgi:hypothetical protein
MGVNWTEQADGSHVAKIGRYRVTIYPPRPWAFYRGDHKGVACQEGPGEHFTVGFHANANDGMSGGAFTLAGAKVVAEWQIGDNGRVHGHPVPESLFPPEELAARRLWDETVAHVDATFGTN